MEISVEVAVKVVIGTLVFIMSHHRIFSADFINQETQENGWEPSRDDRPEMQQACLREIADALEEQKVYVLTTIDSYDFEVFDRKALSRLHTLHPPEQRQALQTVTDKAETSRYGAFFYEPVQTEILDVEEETHEQDTHKIPSYFRRLIINLIPSLQASPWLVSMAGCTIMFVTMIKALSFIGKTWIWDGDVDI